MLIQNIFRAISVILIETKYSSNQIVCTKDFTKRYTLNDFFACKYFYLDFPLLHYFTSILNTKTNAYSYPVHDF